MKTLIMGGVELFQDNKKCTVSIASSMTNMPSVSELDNLRELGESFFDVSMITLKTTKIPKGEDKPDKYVFEYQVPVAAKNLLSIKDSNEILKLSILNEILKENLLEQKTQFIPLIHPANIFFLDMKTIRYLYVDNGELYRNPRPALEQYKALITSMFTNQSFEKMQNAGSRQEILKKKNNLFLIQVEKCTSVMQLQQLIENRLNKTESDFFMYQYNEDSQRKKKLGILLTFLTIGMAVAIVLLSLILIGRS